MTYSQRHELYKRIEDIRQRPLIVYITSSRQNASGAMASDMIPEFTRQIAKISDDKTEVDILIVSHGGDPTVSWRIISLLRERFEKIGTLLPFTAYSAATLLALGTDEIVMHPFSNLGPVDPQLVYVKRDKKNQPQNPNVEKIQFGAEDLRNYIDFIRTEVGISDQEQMERAFELICKDVGSIPIGVAKRSSQLALSMGEKLLSLHMKDQSKAKAIAESLNRSFYHHGYPLGRSEAKEIGLPIIDPEDELETLMWEIWNDFVDEMQCNEPFNPVEIVLSDPNTSALIGPVQQIQIPSNIPPKLMQQAYKDVLQQIQVVNVDPVDYELFQAAVESRTCRSEFRTKGKISAVRLPDMNIAVNVLKISQKWIHIDDQE